MSDSLTISAPQTEATAAWMQECLPAQRGEQIQAAFSRPVVERDGFGSISGNSEDLGTFSFHFISVDLEQALAEFPEVGRRLSFPPGTRLVHFGPGWGASRVRTVATW